MEKNVILSVETTTSAVDSLGKFDARPANFAALAAHEMRSPLRSLRIYLEAVASQYGTNIDPQALELVTRSLHVADRMQRLLDGILECALMEHRPNSPRPLVEMDQLLNNVLSELKGEIDRSEAVITSKGLPAVRYNPEQLETVLTNLIRNAIQYRSAEAPRVLLYAQRLNDLHIICVKDNGQGISPEHHKLIFEPFSQLDRSKGMSRIGLGLYICKSIIEQNGGHMDVHSAIGRGAEFSFSIKVTGND
jgi:signal transduction histidine kinase